MFVRFFKLTSECSSALSFDILGRKNAKFAMRAMIAATSIEGDTVTSTVSFESFVKIEEIVVITAAEYNAAEMMILLEAFFQMSELMGINVLDYKVVVSSGGLFLTRDQPDSNFQLVTIPIMSSNTMPATSIISAMLSVVLNVFTNDVNEDDEGEAMTFIAEDRTIIPRMAMMNNAAGASTISTSTTVFLIAALWRSFLNQFWQFSLYSSDCCNLR